MEDPPFWNYLFIASGFPQLSWRSIIDWTQLCGKMRPLSR